MILAIFEWFIEIWLIWPIFEFLDKNLLTNYFIFDNMRIYNLNINI